MSKTNDSVQLDCIAEQQRGDERLAFLQIQEKLIGLSCGERQEMADLKSRWRFLCGGSPLEQNGEGVGFMVVPPACETVEEWVALHTVAAPPQEIDESATYISAPTLSADKSEPGIVLANPSAGDISPADVRRVLAEDQSRFSSPAPARPGEYRIVRGD